MEPVMIKTNAPGKPRKESVPSFLRKLYQIINEGLDSECIAWSEDGYFFEVKNKTVFQETVLPTHFKHNNMNSFVRQLNMYDFHKVKRSSGEAYNTAMKWISVADRAHALPSHGV